MPIYNEQGERIVYSITEEEVEDYTSNIEGYTITNSYATEKIEISGKKVWKDNDNKEGNRPEKVKINLYADGVLIDSTEVTEESDWMYKFSNLPKYRDGGKEIVYTVDEDEIENYKTEVNGFDITNTYIEKQEEQQEEEQEEEKEEPKEEEEEEEEEEESKEEPQEKPKEEQKEEHKEKPQEAKQVQTGDVKIKWIVGILIFAIIIFGLTKVEIRREK